MSREPGGGREGGVVLDSLFSYRLVSCLLLSGDAEHNELGSVTPPLPTRDPEWRSPEHVFHVFDTQQFTEHTSLVLIRDIIIPVYKQRG